VSKKKSTIIDDDPLAWLKDDADVTNSELETQALDAAVDKEVVEIINVEESGESNVQENKQDSINQVSVKEMATYADSNGEAAQTSVEIEIETQSPGSAAEKTQATDVIEEGETQLSENNEEDVAMATSNSEKIVLEEDVSIVQVAVLKEAWLPVLDSGKDINIDASAVEDIDTAGLQLLLSLVKTAKDSGRSVTWQEPSEAVINAVKETSLRDALGIQL